MFTIVEGFPFERQVSSAAHAAGNIKQALNEVPDSDTRASIFKAVNANLSESGAELVDVTPPVPTVEPSHEKRGPRTNLTRDQLLITLDAARRGKNLHAARAIGRRAL